MLFAIFAIITVLALISLPFAGYIEPVVNSWLDKHINLSAAENGNDYVTTITDVTKNSKLKVHYVFVGQGDCILIDLPDGKNVVIDSGSESYNSETSEKVINYIKNVLLDDGEIIDYLILTHSDSDHVYYMPDILDEFQVATIYRPYTFYVSNGKDSTKKLDNDGTIATKAEKDEIEAKERETVANLNATYNYGITIGDATKSTTNAKNTEIMYQFVSRIYAETYGQSDTRATIKFPIAGETFGGEDYTFTFYAPTNPAKMYSSWNNYSCVMVLDYMGTKMAFTGDAEKVAENEILNNQTNYPLPDVDIMDMGHHGSRTSSQDSFIKALKPEYAIISCGIENKYGHPNQETLDTLHNNGVDDNHIFITAQSGDIVIGFGYTTKADNADNPEQSNVNTASESTSNFIVAYSGDKSYVEPADIYIEWWYIVVSIIVLSGLIFLIIVPNTIKSIKKAIK